MLDVLSAEFLKLRRSKVLMLSIIACLIPALIKYLQYAFGGKGANTGWVGFLSTGQELMVLCVLTAIILVSCFIFSMEYQYNTASYIFTSSTSKVYIYIAKLVLLFAMIALFFLVSSISQLLFGYLAISEGFSGSLFAKFIEVNVWYIFAYFLLSTIIVMVAATIKRFVLSVVIIYGYYMLVFPFHLKGNPYINPFMTPFIVAAKIFDSNDYIFTDYYKDISISITALAAFLAVLAVISLAVGILCYKKMDAVK